MRQGVSFTHFVVNSSASVSAFGEHGVLEKGASGSKRGAPTAATVLEWKLDNERRGGIILSFPTNPAAPSALGGRKIGRFDDPCTLSVFVLGLGVL